MVTTLIVNASPLISLGKIDRLTLLGDPAFRVLVPRSVADEVSVQINDSAARWLAGAGHVYVVPPCAVDPILLAWDLGRGETSVMAEASQHTESIAVLDDLAARRCAQSLGLRCTGTLGFLLMAKRRGLIVEVMPLARQLQQSGLFLGERLLQDVRTAAGE
jgi:predicted nucleic acid-binding protein